MSTVPWWKVLGEQVWQGVRAPLGQPTCPRCSKGLKHDTPLRTNPGFACGYTAHVPPAVSGTVLGKSTGANIT